MSSFQFDFNEDGTVSATSSSESINGTWNVTGDDEFFELEFPSDSSLVFLNDNYTVQYFSGDRIELTVNGNPAELFIFERI